MTYRLLAALVGAAVVIIAAWFGATKALGAHPWWALNVALYGAPAGALLGALLFRAPGWFVVLGAAVLTAAALFVARYGAAGFAASYAEDQFAGQLWFFGWLATCAALALTLTFLIRWLAGRNDEPAA